MGYYIQGPAFNKTQHIIENHEGILLDGEPKKFSDIPEHLALICVVNNGIFEAAGFAFDKREFSDFQYHKDDPRPRVWLTIPKEKAVILTGYPNHS